MTLALLPLLLGATAPPSLSVDLTPIIVALLTLVGVLVTAGYIGGKWQKRLQAAQASEANANAGLAEGQTVMTHAQYEGFIAEAAERLSHMSEAAIARLEAELARAQRRISELETELERAKNERNAAIADSRLREMELQQQLNTLREQVVDLKRRLETQGVRGRRHRDDGDSPRPRRKKDEEPSDE